MYMLYNVIHFFFRLPCFLILSKDFTRGTLIHTDPMLRLRRRLVRVAPQHIALEASYLGQCWNRVKAGLPNLLTLKRCQVFQQPSLARILANGFVDQLQLNIYGEANGFGITKFVKESLNIWEACGLRAGWWEDGLLREGEGGKIPSPEASLVLSPLTTGGSAHFAQSTVNWVNCLSQLQL